MPDYAEMSLVDSPSYFRRTSYRIAGRDHYEITKGFSMELGCGIDVSTPRTEKFDHQSTVDLSMARPSGEQGALVAASRDGQGRTFQPAM